MSDLRDTLEIIKEKCEGEIEEYKKCESEDTFEWGMLTGRKELAEYIVDFANEALATQTKMLRRGETENPTVWDEPLKESTTKVLATLTPREENILRERFGIGDLNRIQKIEDDALNKIADIRRHKKLKEALAKTRRHE